MSQLFDDMPPWLDQELWADFVENRKAIKAPMSEVAQKRMLRKLERWHLAGIDVNGCLERSLINNWKDVYEPDERTSRSSATEQLFERGFRLDLDRPTKH